MALSSLPQLWTYPQQGRSRGVKQWLLEVTLSLEAHLCRMTALNSRAVVPDGSTKVFRNSRKPLPTLPAPSLA